MDITYKPKRDTLQTEGVSIEALHAFENESKKSIFDRKTLKMVKQAAENEKIWIKSLEVMMFRTNNLEQKELLRQMRLDEQKHYKIFEEIYKRFSGEKLETFQVNPIELSKKKAILLKTDNVEFYRKIYLTFSNIDVRDSLFEIITDEQNHSILFSGVY